MATSAQQKAFWSDTGTTSAVYSPNEVNDIFVEAGEAYSDNDVASLAYTRVLGIQRLLANAAKLTDYTQGQSQEKQSQVFSNLRALLTLWQGKVDAAVSDAAVYQTLAQRYSAAVPVRTRIVNAEL